MFSDFWLIIDRLIKRLFKSAFLSYRKVLGKPTDDGCHFWIGTCLLSCGCLSLAMRCKRGGNMEVDRIRNERFEWGDFKELWVLSLMFGLVTCNFIILLNRNSIPCSDALSYLALTHELHIRAMIKLLFKGCTPSHAESRWTGSIGSRASIAEHGLDWLVLIVKGTSAETVKYMPVACNDASKPSPTLYLSRPYSSTMICAFRCFFVRVRTSSCSRCELDIYCWMSSVPALDVKANILVYGENIPVFSWSVAVLF
jgi:hypothetical protein